LEDFNKPVIQR